MAHTITLYDIPSKDQCSCWNSSAWKARMALNLKGLPYRTQWLEYPDIASTLKSFGVPPGPEGFHSIPTVRIGDRYIMDSGKIAQALEELQPEPALQLDSPFRAQSEEVVKRCFQALVPVNLPQIPRNLTNPRSTEYFERTRAQYLGMSLDELEKQKGGDAAWSAAQEPIDDMAKLLKVNDGPYVMGQAASYADLVIVSFLRSMKRINPDTFLRFVGHDEAFDQLHSACQPWLEDDN